MKSTRDALRVYNFFSELSPTFFTAHVIVFELSLNFFLDFGPFWYLSLNLRIKLFPHFLFQSFFLFHQAPDGFIFDLKKLNPSFVLIKNHFLFCELSWQVVRINIHWCFYRFGNQLFSLLLQKFRTQKKRNHSCWGIVWRNTADFWFHVCEVSKFVGQSINWLEIFLEFCHFMMQNCKLTPTWCP